MSTVAESIKRLYDAGKLTAEQLAARVTKGTITQAEYDEIVGV
ncbi:MAG: XkdX family protein [bacterium]